MRFCLLGKCTHLSLTLFFLPLTLSHRIFQDVYSYDMEQSKGHTGNNIITVLMDERGFSLQEASDCVGKVCKYQMQRYLDALSRLRLSSSDVPRDAVRYIEALGYWMVGNLVYVNPFRALI
jgi:hypothetical protein